MMTERLCVKMMTDGVLLMRLCQRKSWKEGGYWNRRKEMPGTKGKTERKEGSDWN